MLHLPEVSYEASRQTLYHLKYLFLPVSFFHPCLFFVPVITDSVHKTTHELPTFLPSLTHDSTHYNILSYLSRCNDGLGFRFRI